MRQLLRLSRKCEDHFFNSSLNHNSTFLFSNFKLLLLFLGENKAIEWYLINFSVRKCPVCDNQIKQRHQQKQKTCAVKYQNLHCKLFLTEEKVNPQHFDSIPLCLTLPFEKLLWLLLLFLFRRSVSTEKQKLALQPIQE